MAHARQICASFVQLYCSSSWSGQTIFSDGWTALKRAHIVMRGRPRPEGLHRWVMVCRQNDGADFEWPREGIREGRVQLLKEIAVMVADRLFFRCPSAHCRRVDVNSPLPDLLRWSRRAFISELYFSHLIEKGVTNWRNVNPWSIKPQTKLCSVFVKFALLESRHNKHGYIK